MKLREFSEALLDTPSSHRVIGISGVSGAGKTTIIQQLIADMDGQAGYVRSFTTRQQRPDDRPEEYEYITEAEFSVMEGSGEITWKVGAHGNFYGNSFKQFHNAVRSFRYSLIAITPETILKVNGIIPKTRLRLFHLVAPSEDEQRRRMEMRKECERTIEHRILTSRTWEREVECIADPQACPITFIGQGSIRDMYMEFLNSLDIPAS